MIDRWSRMFCNRLRQVEIPVYLIKKYVDDVNLAVGLLEKGWKWERQETGELSLVWTQERMYLDVREAISEEERSMERLREMASDLVEGIVFTVDLPSRHRSGKVPMLDIAVWMEKREGEGHVVRHTYYEK